MSPTRLNPPQILDICVMDMSQFYQSPVIEAPLQVDQDKTGVDSDHFIVTITPIGTLSDKKSFQKKRIQFRPLNNDQGYFYFFRNIFLLLQPTQIDFCSP